MSAERKASAVKISHGFGLRAGVQDNVICVDESTAIFPIGRAIAGHSPGAQHAPRESLPKLRPGSGAIAAAPLHDTALQGARAADERQPSRRPRRREGRIHRGWLLSLG